MAHICKICGASSDETVFYTRVTSRCAECHKTKVRENRAANVEYYRAYDAKRFRDDPRVLARMKKYAATDQGKLAYAKAKQKWIMGNPDKRAAQVILGHAVRDGRVIKSRSCERCGSGGRIHGHHHDYAKPLEVKWLCPRCHTAEHKRLNDETHN